MFHQTRQFLFSFTILKVKSVHVPAQKRASTLPMRNMILVLGTPPTGKTGTRDLVRFVPAAPPCAPQTDNPNPPLHSPRRRHASLRPLLFALCTKVAQVSNPPPRSASGERRRAVEAAIDCECVFWCQRLPASRGAVLEKKKKRKEDHNYWMEDVLSVTRRCSRGRGQSSPRSSARQGGPGTFCDYDALAGTGWGY